MHHMQLCSPSPPLKTISYSSVSDSEQSLPFFFFFHCDRKVYWQKIICSVSDAYFKCNGHRLHSETDIAQRGIIFQRNGHQNTNHNESNVKENRFVLLNISSRVFIIYLILYLSILAERRFGLIEGWRSP